MFFSCRYILGRGAKEVNEVVKDNLFDIKTNEANIKLNERLNADNNSPNGENVGGSTTEANLNIQDAFYGENNKKDVVPTYVTNETAAVKITGGSEDK